MSRLWAIDAFAGAGGLSLGLQRADWTIALAFDNDPVAVATYEKNIAGNVLNIDAETLTGAELLERSGLSSGECGLLAGGPPCQGFSLQRRGTRVDERNRLILRFLDWIDVVRPKGFLIENVPAIRSVRGSDLLSAVEEATRTWGYKCHVMTLNAVEFHVAQNRRRAFLIGTRTGHFGWPRPSNDRHTVWDAIGDLPSPPADGSEHPIVPNHYREARLSALNKERIRHVPQGGGRLDLPAHLQLACHQGSHRHLDTYGRLAWDQPSVTITARFDSFTRGRFGHPVEDRSLTLREGARIQGFPDEFVFLGNREECARMIGNAVPPPLAEALGRSLRYSLLAEAQAL